MRKVNLLRGHCFAGDFRKALEFITTILLSALTVFERRFYLCDDSGFGSIVPSVAQLLKVSLRRHQDDLVGMFRQFPFPS